MESVGAFEAKTHLARLLERAARGERVVITNRGKPIAMLIPPEVGEPADAAEVGRAMLAYRDEGKRRLGGSFRDLAHQGHRHSSRARDSMITPHPPDRLVLDGSITLAWLFHDEKDPYADAIVGKLPGLEMLVPRLWHLEVANVLLVGERRGCCTQADVTTWLSFHSALPVVVDRESEARAWSDTIAIGRQHSLSSYDAANLELALREGVPLATLDAKLDAAATAAGVATYRP